MTGYMIPKGGTTTVREKLNPKNEPVAIGAAVVAVLNVLMAFGVDLTAAQVTAVNVAVVAVGGLVVRYFVTPNDRVIIGAADIPQDAEGWEVTVKGEGPAE